MKKKVFVILLFSGLIEICVGGSVWDGGGADASWGTPENWNSDTLPAFDGTETITFSGLSSGTNLTLDGDRRIRSITLPTGNDISIRSGTPSGSRLEIQGGSISLSANTRRHAFDCPILLLGNVAVTNAGASGAFIRFQGPILDEGEGYGLSVAGLRNTTLSASNDFRGPVLLMAGVLYVADDFALGHGTLIYRGGALFASGNRTVTNSLDIEATPFNFGNNGGSGMYFTAPGIVSLKTNVEFKLTQATGAGSELRFMNGIREDIPGCSMTHNHNRTMWLYGTSTFTGPVILQSGTLRFGGTLMASSVQQSGGTIEIAAHNPLGTGTLFLAGGRFSSAGTRWQLDNDAFWSGTHGIMVNGGSHIDFNLDGGAAILTDHMVFDHRGTSSDPATSPKFHRGFQETNGSFGITWKGSPSRYIRLAGTSTYTGPTIVTDLIVRVEAENALPTNTALSVFSTVQMLGNATTIGSLQGNGAVDTGGGLLTLGGDGTASYEGRIMGAGGRLLKVGSGVQRLAWTNLQSYTGWTRIEGGILRLDDGLTSQISLVEVVGGCLGGTGLVNRPVRVYGGGRLGAHGVTVPEGGMLRIPRTVTLEDEAALVWTVAADSQDRIAVSDLVQQGAVTLYLRNYGRAIQPEDTFEVVPYTGSLTGFEPGQWTLDTSESPIPISVRSAQIENTGAAIVISGLRSPVAPGTVIQIR